VRVCVAMSGCGAVCIPSAFLMRAMINFSAMIIQNKQL